MAAALPARKSVFPSRCLIDWPMSAPFVSDLPKSPPANHTHAASNPNAQPTDLTKAFNLPPEQHHNWKYVRFGPDGKIYVPFGAPCNICEPPTKEYAQIRRYNPDGSGMAIFKWTWTEPG